MQRKLIAANWKMNLHHEEALQLARRLADASADLAAVDVVVCPPTIHLRGVAECLGGTGLELGAQNVYFEPNGAYTGETSVSMLADAGCTYVILGHSERRWILGETDAEIQKKARAALARGLTPIVCVGELLEQREAGRTLHVIEEQFLGSLGGLMSEQIGKCVIAYEPVWAIGTGKVATPPQAEEVHTALRSLLKSVYTQARADMVRVLYGGSVKPENARELLDCPNIDGFLVGGASLIAESFVAIAKAAIR